MSHPFYSTPAWRKLRARVVRRDHYRCIVCKASVATPGSSRVDHIKPRKTHPHLELVESNCRTLCAACDNRRHAEKGGAPRGCDVNGIPLDPNHHWARG